MADDPDPSVRPLLVDELIDLEPKIRGFGDISLDEPQASGLEVSSISPDGLVALAAQLKRTIHRRTLIQAVLDGMDRVRGLLDDLRADGWPMAVAPAAASASVLLEFRRGQSDVQAAVSMFREDLVVGFDATVSVADVPQPVPDQNP